MGSNVTVISAGSASTFSATHSAFSGLRLIPTSTASASACSGRVESSRFERFSKFAPGRVLAAGIDIHLDPRGSVDALITGNTFRGVASALQFTASRDAPQIAPSGGRLSVVAAIRGPCLLQGQQRLSQTTI